MGPVFDAPPEQLDGMIAGMGMPIAAPALYLHGADDGCVGSELVRGMDGFFPAGLRTEIVPGAGHFVHHEQPDVVNRLVPSSCAADGRPVNPRSAAGASASAP